jgi:Fe-Mn family superoxide dismutase
MSTESSSLNRRHFLTLGAVAGAGIVVATALPEAGAAGVVQAAAPAPIKPKPLADKVYTTEAAGISRKTHDEHFKLYTGYVNKVNEIRTKLAALGVPDPTKANATFSDLRELKVEYSFALGGVKNHELYFGHLGGKGGAPNGAIADAITTTFGSYDNWKADLKATGIAARGWVWLALDYTDGSLFNYIGDAQNSFPIWNAAPVLALDVYEHAYFIDFGSARAKYLDAFLNVIDWDAVNANFAVAQTMLKAGK